ncbi:hypothetical protein ACNKHV_22485 [Shigella flexneri]
MRESQACACKIKWNDEMVIPHKNAISTIAQQKKDSAINQEINQNRNRKIKSVPFSCLVAEKLVTFIAVIVTY